MDKWRKERNLESEWVIIGKYEQKEETEMINVQERGPVYETILPFVLEAGRMIAGSRDPGVSIKGANDFVTEMDRAVQDYLLENLGRAFPEAVFIAEEKDNVREVPMGEVLIIDPIDGTTNFINGFPACAVCAAYVLDKKVECAFVYNPLREEIFSAVRGKGAWLGDMPIRCKAREMRQSVCLIGDSWEGNKDVLRKYFASCRMIGSAALQICYVACGRAAADITKELRIWDYAAGMLIAEEAGACVLNKDGEPQDLEDGCALLVCTPGIRQETMAIWRESMDKSPRI